MRLVAQVFLSLAFAAPALAQPAVPSASPDPASKHSGAPLGQFTAGPFVVTPTFRIGTLAVDTNVQYSRTRRADFVAAAGPGLDIALPFLDHWQFDIQGISQYMYFQRTTELRRWTGGGSASLNWATTGTRASVSGGLTRDFSRPNFEVDARIATTRTGIQANLERDLGRLTLALDATVAKNDVDAGEEFRGADLAISLTTNQVSVKPDFRYRLTPLTSLLIELEYQETRFPRALARDYHQTSAGVGFLFAGFLKGRVTGGIRRNELNDGGDQRTQPYLRGTLVQNVGRRLRLGESYTQESTVSAFAVDGTLPTFERRSFRLDVGIDLTSRIDMRLNGAIEKVRSDGLVRVILDDGSLSTGRRDDTAYVTGADIGIRLGRARLAGFVSYTTRESQFFSDFGIDGLLAGARVEYSPGR